MASVPSAPTAADDRAGEVRYRSPRGRMVLLATVLGSGIAFLDATVVNIALPAIGEDLDAGLSGLQWTVNAYALTLAGLVKPPVTLAARSGDKFRAWLRPEGFGATEIRLQGPAKTVFEGEIKC